jgi:hypothetical protein
MVILASSELLSTTIIDTTTPEYIATGLTHGLTNDASTRSTVLASFQSRGQVRESLLHQMMQRR